MQQPIASPQSKPNNTRRWIWIGAAAVIAFCCCIGVFILASSRNQAPVPAPTREQPAPGATVEINAPTPTTGPTVTPAPNEPALGVTRDEPFPKDTTIDIGDGMQVTILEVIRPADDVVRQGNMFNDTPVPNVQEYVMVKLHVECTKSSNEKCTFNSYEFKTVGADGQVHDPASVAGIPQEFEPFAEFFGGSALDGNIVFLVTQGDPEVVLFHDPLIFGDPIYIALQ